MAAIPPDNAAQPAAGASFAGQASRLNAELKRAGLQFRDMRREQQLEMQLIGPGVDWESPGRSKRVPIERLEGPIAALPVASPAHTPSRLRYFLDGSQRTLPALLIGSVPVIASIAAAAILERDDRGDGRIMPGMLRLKHTWLIPKRLPEIEPFLEIVERLGMDVIDPLARLTNDDDYFEAAGDYARLVEFGHRAANNARSELENDLLQAWNAEPERVNNGWILVDGTLRASVPQAVGLVKSFTRQYLAGADAACLFGLPPGHRTTAFRAVDGWRDEVAMWFLRFRDAAGRDARHSLVRIEVAPQQATTELINNLSSWLMAERVPRATADARWATLLYPVHYLERILKRYVDADTRGWPGARAGV